MNVGLKEGDLVTVWSATRRDALRAEVVTLGPRGEPWFAYKYLPRAQDSIAIVMRMDLEGVQWLHGWSDDADDALAVAHALGATA